MSRFASCRKFSVWEIFEFIKEESPLGLNLNVRTLLTPSFDFSSRTSNVFRYSSR